MPASSTCSRGSSEPSTQVAGSRSLSPLDELPPGRADEATHAEHKHRQVDEGPKRGTCPVDLVAKSAEALQSTWRPLHYVRLRPSTSRGARGRSPDRCPASYACSV